MEIRLKLKVNGVEIELSKDDATELRDALNGLVGETRVVCEYPRWYTSGRYTDDWATKWTSTTGDMNLSAIV